MTKGETREVKLPEPRPAEAISARVDPARHSSNAAAVMEATQGHPGFLSLALAHAILCVDRDNGRTLQLHRFKAENGLVTGSPCGAFKIKKGRRWAKLTLKLARRILDIYEDDPQGLADAFALKKIEFEDRTGGEMQLGLPQ